MVREAGQWEGCPTGPQSDPRTPAGGRGHLPFPALSADSAFLLLAGPFPFFSFLVKLRGCCCVRALRPPPPIAPADLSCAGAPGPSFLRSLLSRLSLQLGGGGSCRFPVRARAGPRTRLGTGGGEARRVDREGLALATTPAEFGRFCRFLKTCRMRVKDSSRQQRPRPLTPAAAASRLVLRTRSSHLTVKSDLYSV